LVDELSQNFAIRAFFLDIGAFTRYQTLVKLIVQFHLHRPVRLLGESEVYAPDLPDFEYWTQFEADCVQRVLGAHRERTRNPTSVFRGGAYDQIAGNWQDI